MVLSKCVYKMKCTGILHQHLISIMIWLFVLFYKIRLVMLLIFSRSSTALKPLGCHNNPNRIWMFWCQANKIARTQRSWFCRWVLGFSWPAFLVGQHFVDKVCPIDFAGSYTHGPRFRFCRGQVRVSTQRLILYSPMQEPTFAYFCIAWLKRTHVWRKPKLVWPEETCVLTAFAAHSSNAACRFK